MVGEGGWSLARGSGTHSAQLGPRSSSAGHSAGMRHGGGGWAGVQQLGVHMGEVLGGHVFREQPHPTQNAVCSCSCSKFPLEIQPALGNAPGWQEGGYPLPPWSECGVWGCTGVGGGSVPIQPTLSPLQGVHQWLRRLLHQHGWWDALSHAGEAPQCCQQRWAAVPDPPASQQHRGAQGPGTGTLGAVLLWHHSWLPRKM